MTKRTSKDRAAKKRAERRKRHRGNGGEESSGGGLMMGMRGGFKSAVGGKKSPRGRRSLPGWLPILLEVVALLVLIRRLGLF